MNYSASSTMSGQTQYSSRKANPNKQGSVSVSPVYEQVMALNEYRNPLDSLEYAVGRFAYALKTRVMPAHQIDFLVAYPEPRNRLRKELSQSKLLGQTPDGKAIYLFDHFHNSSVMRELGRLRALTFKVVGEGTKALRDIDSYDRYYRHIVLWDDTDSEIVGAYRIGEAFSLSNDEAQPLYSQRLFDYQASLRSLFPQAIELGRSFIQPKYWSKRGLDYLWMGIGAYLSAHPHVRYLFGAVSISNDFPTLAKHQIVGCFARHFQPIGHRTLAKSRRPFYVDRGVLESYRELSFVESLAKLKQQLKDQGVVLPTLYKHYADLCEADGTQFIDFNIDPQFGHCIDGLMWVDLAYIKDKKRRRYLDTHTV